ncbi:filamentous hemagglutinin N-terminal domain-containing protein [Salmonella enterica]|nr:filamentous hemagglutinin N-terminal domain-containing protein [Salmonella enterica]EJN1667686.1 filamentous hemagglutinin N-terminal domain-containing protein [Salmonella enterica]
MNKIYKLKYDRRRNQLVAVSELTAGAGKETTGSVTGLAGQQGVSTFRSLLGTLTPLAVMTGLIIGMLPGLALANPDLPTGGQVVAGQGSISTSGNQMTIQQNTHGLVTNWSSFDIGKNHTVQFVQPDSSAVALNRVTGGHESQILGTLNANGQVMLVNPAGVMFGKGAKVNTAGLVASTKNIRTEDFMAGRYTFSGGSHPGAEVVNQGSLTTTKGGYIVLAADRVKNSGTITTPSGKTVLAAAEKVTLQLDNTGLASVSVNGSVVNALVENSGLIAAANGQVYLTARGKDMLLNRVVNNSGTVEARGLNQQGGNIVLDGGDSGVVSQSGMLLADSDTGRGGKITVQGQNIHLAAGSRTSATGKTGGGEVYAGGGWQGKDSRIKNASKVVTDRSSVVDVSATGNGNGGTAVLWSEDYTNFRGSILAQGGAESGKGGRVETSSRGTLLAAGDVQAGKGGEWLLDPADITIVSGNTNTNVSETGKGTDSKLDEDTAFTLSPSAATGSQVGADKITEKLNDGTNVTIKTTPAKENDTGTGGNITVSAGICVTGSNAVALTLEADGNISISNQNITSSSGKLDVNLLGAGSKTGMIKLDKAKIETHGGNITLGQLNHTESSAVALTVNVGNGSMLNTSVDSGVAGDITINAYNPNVNLSVGELKDTVRNGGVLLGVQSSTLKGNNITLTGTQKGANANQLPVFLNDKSTLNATGDITLTGNSSAGSQATQLEFRGKNDINATGNISVSNTGSQILFNGSNLTSECVSLVAGGDITIKGERQSAADAINITNTVLNSTGSNVNVSGYVNVTNGGGTGVLLNNVNVSAASGNITMDGKGFDSSNGALRLQGNNNFSAKNTVLSGEAGRNNTGAWLGGNLNVTQGNLSVTGTSHHFNTGDTYRGLKADKLNLTVSSGSLNLTGKSVAYDGRGAQQGAVAGLELINSCLSASSAALTGSSVDSGSGFILNNVTLSGGIEHGANLTLSSAGSAAGVSNTLDTKLTYGNFQKLVASGIENNTTISLVTSDNELLKALNYDESNQPTDWTADFGSLTEKFKSSVEGKTGLWNVQGLDGVCASVTGNISLTGVEKLINGNLTAGNSLNLSGATGKSLVLTNTNLTATSGNVSLSGDAVKLSGTKNGATNLQTINASQGSVIITANGNVSGNALDVSNLSFSSKDGVTLNGTSTRNGQNVNGVKLDGLINVTGGGNLAVTGTSTRVNNAGNVRGIAAGGATINVAGTLNMTGTVNGDANATATTQVVGLDLGRARLNATSANLSGVSTAKGFGFWMNSSLSGKLAEAVNVNLSAEGSGGGVSNYIGSDVSSAVVKGVFDAHSDGIGGITEVQNATIFSDELSSSTGGDLDKDYGNWLMDFSGITLNKTGNISIKGASFTNSNLTAGKNLNLTSVGNLALNTGNISAKNIYLEAANITLSGNISHSGTEVGVLNITAGSGITLGDIKQNITEGNNGSLNVNLKGGNVTDAWVTVNGNVSVNGDVNITGAIKEGDSQPHLNINVNKSANITAKNISLGGNGQSDGRVVVSGKLNASDNISIAGLGMAADAVRLERGSGLVAKNIQVNGATNGGQRTGLVLDGANLNATDTLDINGSYTGPSMFSGGIWANGGKLEATNININGSSIKSAGTKILNVMMNASGSLNINGTSVIREGVYIDQKTNLNATNGCITLHGTSRDGKGLHVAGNVTASSLNISGKSTVSGEGFRLENLVLKGGVANGANVSLSSAGSPADVLNYIGDNIFDKSHAEELIKTGIENSTRINATGFSLGNGNGNGDWSHDYTVGEKKGGWIFDGATVNQTGIISLKGAGFVNSNLTATDITIDDSRRLVVNNTSLNVTTGNITLKGDGITSTCSTISAMQGEVVLNGTSTGRNLNSRAVLLDKTNISAKNNININVDTSGGTAIHLAGSTLNSTGGAVVLNGSGSTSGYSAGVITVSNSNLSALQNISMLGIGHEEENAVQQGGVAILGNVNLTAPDIILNGSHVNAGLAPGDYAETGVVFGRGNGNISIIGNLSAEGSAHNDGVGVSVGANLTVSGLSSITGTSDSGSGVLFSTNPEYKDEVRVNISMTGGGSIKGTSASGQGVASIASGSVVNVSSGMDNKLLIQGESTTGEGVSWGSAIKSATSSGSVILSGDSVSGTGVKVSGGSISGINVLGTTSTGSGVSIRGNLKTETTTITGNSSGSGTGAVLGGKITGDSHDRSVISGTSEQGDGMVVADGTEATRVTLSGRATNGVGIRVKGALKNEDSVLDGQATGTGTGVELAGPVSGGVVTGFSEKGTGITAGKGSKLDNVAVTGKTADGVGVELNGQPDITGGATVKGEVSGNGRVSRIEGDDDHDDWSDIPALTPDEQVPGGSHPAWPDQDNGREESVFRELQEHILQAEDSRASLYRPDRVKDVVRPSGYREQARPVSVDICTDGECRKLDVGQQDRPVR